MSTPISAAAIQALSAYGAPQRSGPQAAGGGDFAALQRETVRLGAGVTVELSAEARATLIAVQSAASAPMVSRTSGRAADPGSAGPIERPGSRLNLTI